MDMRRLPLSAAVVLVLCLAAIAAPVYSTEPSSTPFTPDAARIGLNIIGCFHKSIAGIVTGGFASYTSGICLHQAASIQGPVDITKQPTIEESPSFLLLICREENGAIQVLNSTIVPGQLKPAYSSNIQPQMAELLDDNGLQLTQAFYNVVRDIHWDAPKEEGSNELIGGVIPAPDVVFAVRVPYVPQAKTLRLSAVNDPEALKSRQELLPGLSPVPVSSDDIKELLVIPLSDLPGMPEVTQ